MNIKNDTKQNSLGRDMYPSPSYSVDKICLLYTSDAADDLLCVDLGGRRIIKKKTTLIPAQ